MTHGGEDGRNDAASVDTGQPVGEVRTESGEPVGKRRRIRFGSMSRRVRTLVVASVLFVVLFVLALTMPVPYVVLSPGPTYNTLGTDDGGRSIISIKGHKLLHDSGHLNLTTVSVSTSSISAFQAISGWLAKDEVVVPRSAVYPPGQSQQQTDNQNTADFTESQDDAISAASCQLKYPRKFGVVGVESGGASAGKLQPADVLRTVDGAAASSQTALLAALAAKKPGTTVSVTAQRAGKAVTESVKLGPPAKNRTNGSLGIEVGTVCATPFTVDLGLGNEIGGPSAGLMFALGIMQKVGPTDLTKGRFIAGTGTISATGQVGPIGGIALKMIAARAKGATVFLAPVGNCPDVRKGVPSGLRVVAVSSLSGAVGDLEKIEHDQSVPGC